MIYFKSDGKWYPIHIRHFDGKIPNNSTKFEIKVLGKVYNGPSDELQEALRLERFWSNLTDKG